MNEYILNGHRRFLGVEVGIETGSPRLAREIMRAKSLPYQLEEWPNIVEDAFKIMHENSIIPAATIILGMPGETSDDVIKTIELLDRLRGYRSIIVPMFFVPMGSMKERRWFIKDNLKKEHVDALIRMYEHTVFWAEDIINNYYLKNPASYPVRFLLKYFIRYVKKQVNKYIKIIEENIRQ